MLVGTYQFHCRFKNSVLLPGYKGSTLRGVFGRALKAVTCTHGARECSGCDQRMRCLYTQIFETELPTGNLPGKNSSSPPHPFVIEPPLSWQTEYKPDEVMAFNLLLFGHTNRNLAYFVRAFEKMGQIGIGRRVDGHRGNFALEKVTNGDSVVYDRAAKFISTVMPWIDFVYPPYSESQATTAMLSVDLCTPLRIKFKNQYQANLPFHVLIRACLRRMSSLLNTYGEGEPALDYPALVKLAETVSTASQDLRWFDWRRYSFRQDQAMLMGGMVGKVTYSAVPGVFIPLLQFCKKVHIGKQTAFGLGMIDLNINAERKFV